MEENNQTKSSADIFAWANHVSRFRKELDVEFFVVNKRYTPYFLQMKADLAPQVGPVFVAEIFNYIEKGAGLGLELRPFEDSETEDGVLLYSTRERVSNARMILEQIENERAGIETFNEYDHEFKTIKMVIARFSHKDTEPFYVVKQVSGSSSLTERNAWQIDTDGKLEPFTPSAAFKIPTDNQVLITGEHIFAFNTKKFEAMFGYAYKKQAIADKKIEQILSRYQLNFPEGQDLNTLIAGRTKSINKLQNMELGTKTQEQLMEYSEEMALDLMTSDDGSIIIMDGRDVDTFVGLLNDDYMTSDLTGLKYEVKAKRLLNGESDGA